MAFTPTDSIKLALDTSFALAADSVWSDAAARTERDTRLQDVSMDLPYARTEMWCEQASAMSVGAVSTSLTATCDAAAAASGKSATPAPPALPNAHAHNYVSFNYRVTPSAASAMNGCGDDDTAAALAHCKRIVCARHTVADAVQEARTQRLQEVRAQHVRKATELTRALAAVQQRECKPQLVYVVGVYTQHVRAPLAQLEDEYDTYLLPGARHNERDGRTVAVKVACAKVRVQRLRDTMALGLVLLVDAELSAQRRVTNAAGTDALPLWKALYASVKNYVTLARTAIQQVDELEERTRPQALSAAAPAARTVPVVGVASTSSALAASAAAAGGSV